MDLESPQLPAIIGELGANGKRGAFQATQKAVTSMPGFDGNVKFIETRKFWEPDVESFVNDGVRKSLAGVRFYNVGSDRGYHYLGSTRSDDRIGSALGRGMLELMNQSLQGHHRGAREGKSNACSAKLQSSPLVARNHRELSYGCHCRCILQPTVYNGHYTQ